jgi:hypothetical protein
MADSEQQSAQSQEASEAMGSASGDSEDSKKKELELLKDGLSVEQEGSRSVMAAENLDRVDDQGKGGGGGEGSDVDPAKTDTDHEETAAVVETDARNGKTVSDKASSATATKEEGNLDDKALNQQQIPEKLSNEESNKTPPPEPDELEVEEIKEARPEGQSQGGPSIPAPDPPGPSIPAPDPPKQKVGGRGGLGGIFAQFKRGFSLGPRRGKDQRERKREGEGITRIHLFCMPRTPT